MVAVHRSGSIVHILPWQSPDYALISSFNISARGTEGGLHSTDWTIAPEGKANAKSARGALGAFASDHIELLLQLLRGLVRYRLRPEMQDSCSNNVSFGWYLNSTLTFIGSRRVRSRLADMFGTERLDARGELSIFYPLEARIQLSSTRYRTESDPDASLIINHKLGHAINGCLFRHLRRSGELSMSAETAARMDSLEALIAGIDDSWIPTGAHAFAHAERVASGSSASSTGPSASQP